MKIYLWWLNLALRKQFYSWWIDDFSRLIGVHGRLLNGNVRSGLVWMYYLLYPVRSFHQWLHDHEGYDPRLDCWYIHGSLYSDIFFSTLNRAPNDTNWILHKTKDGGFTIVPYDYDHMVKQLESLIANSTIEHMPEKYQSLYDDIGSRYCNGG